MSTGSSAYPIYTAAYDMYALNCRCRSPCGKAARYFLKAMSASVSWSLRPPWPLRLVCGAVVNIHVLVEGPAVLRYLDVGKLVALSCVDLLHENIAITFPEEVFRPRVHIRLDIHPPIRLHAEWSGVETKYY